MKQKMPNWFWTAENFALFPIVLCVFPVPLALPITLIGMCIGQPEEWPLAIIFFTYLALSIWFMLHMDNKYDR